MATAAGRGAPGWGLIRRAVRPHRRALVAAVVVGVSWTAVKVTVPTLTGKAIDNGVRNGDDGDVLRWALLILGFGVVAATLTGCRRWFASRVAYGVESDVRGMLHDHLIGLHPGYFDTTSTGQLMSRAASDVQQVQMLFMMLPMALSNAVTVVAVTGVLLVTDWRLALLSLSVLPLLTIVAQRFSRAMFPVSVTVQQELAGLATVVEETVSGIRVVKGFGAEALQSEQLRDRGQRVFDQGMRLGRIRAFYMPLTEIIPSFGLAAVLWGGGHAVMSGRLSLGTMISFTSYVLMLVWPLRTVGWMVAISQRAAAASNRLVEVLDVPSALVERDAPTSLPADGGEVRLEGVRFSYAPGLPDVLADLDLHLRAGEAVALVGPTGSGKSTIARILSRSYDVTAGRVLLDGVDLRDLPLRTVRTGVSSVPEDTFLFSDTVAANIAFARPGATTDDIRAAARLAGADAFVAELPDGYDTVLGERGQSLSGGQRQRLALARAILSDPRVLILDDATSAVDPSKEHEIRGALATAMAGRTTLVIAHRPATIALADRVVLLDVDATGGHARIVAEGPHHELLATSARYREVLARTAEAHGETVGDAREIGHPATATVAG